MTDSQPLAPLLALHSRADGSLYALPNEFNRNNRVFGGQLLGYALAAAAHGVVDRAVTSLQVQFLQGALVGEPIDLAVETVQSGRRFLTRQVRATQGERGIVLAQVAFQTPQADVLHAQAAPAGLPGPLELPTLEALNDAYVAAHPGQAAPLPVSPALDRRLIDGPALLLAASAEPVVRQWVRVREPLGDDPALHAAAMAYLSDSWYFFYAALAPHMPMLGARDRIHGASLNHMLWLHRPCRVDEWLLFDARSTHAASGRMLVQIQVFDVAGLHVASVAQELAAAPRT